MENQHYYTVKSLKEFEFSEIDFDLYDELFPKVDKDEDNDFLQIGTHDSDGYPINIDRLIKKLEEFKQIGANYVSLCYHEDHIGYPLEAMKIESSLEVEITEYRAKLEERKKKQIQAELLRKQADDLLK